MSTVKDVIGLVKDAISSGLARIEHSPATDRHNPVVRFILSQDPHTNQPQYVGEVIRANEPEEVSIARRLLSGNLNIGYVSAQETSQGAVDLLTHIQDITTGKDRALLLADFNSEVKELYTKEVEIFLLDHRVSDESLLLGAEHGSLDALKELDSKGYYQKVATFVIADNFDQFNNLNAVINCTTSLREAVQWQERSGVIKEPNVTEFRAISAGDVVKMDGKTFALKPTGFEPILAFKGVPIPERQRDPQRKSFSFQDLLSH